MGFILVGWEWNINEINMSRQIPIPLVFNNRL